MYNENVCEMLENIVSEKIEYIYPIEKNRLVFVDQVISVFSMCEQALCSIEISEHEKIFRLYPYFRNIRFRVSQELFRIL